MSVFEGFRFRRVSSPIHRLDPRVKFVYVCAAFVVAVMFNELVPLLCCSLFRYRSFWWLGFKGSGFDP